MHFERDTGMVVFRVNLNDSNKSELVSTPLTFSLGHFVANRIRYELVLGKVAPTTSESNFGDFVTPVFVRPDELAIFDGCSLSIDVSPGVSPVQPRYGQLADSEDSFKLAWIDEPRVNRLTGEYPLLQVDPSPGESALVDPDLSAFCSFKHNGQCVHCVQGYVYEHSLSKCVLCLSAYNHYSGTCEALTAPSMPIAEISESYTASTFDPSAESENVAYVCHMQTISDFYAECLSKCSTNMGDLQTGQINNFVYEFTLHPRLEESLLQLPMTYVLYHVKSDGTPSFFTRPFALSDVRSQIRLKLEGQYAADGEMGFAVHLPNHRSHLAENESLITATRKIFYSFSPSDFRSAKTPGVKYFINDFCDGHLLVQGLYWAECLDSIPPGSRTVTSRELRILLPCGRHCLLCDSTQCTECEPGFYRVAGHFECQPCSAHCHGCTESPDNCTMSYFRELVASVFFFDYQRSGFIEAGQRRVCWRYHTFLTDRGQRGEDLTGGFFDGPGTLKLNLQLSFVTVTLAQTLMYLSDELRHAQVYNPLASVVRTALEYLIKCYVDDDNIYSHCGTVAEDDAFWGRPEDFDRPRQCYKVPAGGRAIDLMANLASAYAAGSVVFRETDSEFAEALRSKAQALHDLARSSTGESVYSYFPELSSRYGSNKQFQDELLEASLLLDLANRDTARAGAYEAEFLARGFDKILKGNLNNKQMSINFLMFKATGEVKYLRHIEDYIAKIIQNPKSPGGLTLVKKKTFIFFHNLLLDMLWAIILAKEPLSSKKSQLELWVRSQLDYLLGLNPSSTSFQIGVAGKYITQARHKASSCPSPPDQCGPSAETSPHANPNPVVGAIIQSVRADDVVDDSRTNSNNRIRLINNAALPGVLAAVFMRFGDPKSVDTQLFPSTSACSDGPGDYIGPLSWNVALHELFQNNSISSPFPLEIRSCVRFGCNLKPPSSPVASPPASSASTKSAPSATLCTGSSTESAYSAPTRTNSWTLPTCAWTVPGDAHRAGMPHTVWLAPRGTLLCPLRNPASHVRISA